MINDLEKTFGHPLPLCRPELLENFESVGSFRLRLFKSALTVQNPSPQKDRVAREVYAADRVPLGFFDVSLGFFELPFPGK